MYFLQLSPLPLLLSLVLRVTARLSNAPRACETLRTTLPGLIFFPSSEDYEKSISSYAFIGTRLRPTCLAAPKSKNDVVSIVQTLGKFESVAFAIRSGGHNTNKGFADIEDGVTIDLSALNAVRLNRTAHIVSVGTGARWKNVYDAVDPYGIAVQGGRNSDVGVAGFLTGGGIGFFSPERGWACDSVANFEVVLSTGEVVNANATSRTDLFTALKGGLNNFGIVTRFDLKTFPQGPLWGGVVIYPNSTDKQLLKTLSTIKDPKNFDPHAIFTFGFVYDAAKGAFTADVAMYHSHPERVPGSALETFAKIEPQLFNTVRNASAGAFAGEKLSTIIQSFYMHWSTITIAVSSKALSRMHALFKSTSYALTNEYASAGLTVAISIQSVPAAAPASNHNSLGFHPWSSPEKKLLNLGVAFRYDDPAATDGLEEAIKTFTAGLYRIAREEGVLDTHLYLNYAGGWQDVFAGYGNGSLQEMRQVARKYDERGMFQKQVKGGFKLDK